MTDCISIIYAELNNTYVALSDDLLNKTDFLGLAPDCQTQIDNGLKSGRNKKLLAKIAKLGCTAPTFVPDGPCCKGNPDRGGQTHCKDKLSTITVCCINTTYPIEEIIYHELHHAYDCCAGRLSNCDDDFCSEVNAYYSADCAHTADPLACALRGAEGSLSGSCWMHILNEYPTQFSLRGAGWKCLKLSYSANVANVTSLSSEGFGTLTARTCLTCTK